MDGESRGVLYPARLPELHRFPAPSEVTELVRWLWIPEWNLTPGRTSRQHLVAYPASNLVVEPGLVGFSGPTTRASYRDLSGTGWAVGALLRPAAVPGLVTDPGALRDAYVELSEPGLLEPVHEAMNDTDPASRRTRAVAAFTGWLRERIGAISEEGRLANTMADLLDSDSSVLRLADAAASMGVSPRTLQRLARRYVGLSPYAMIRRRRLQEAADRIRRAPDVDLARVAAELGYADQAHLAGDFRRVLGFTASTYRSTLAEGG